MYMINAIRKSILLFFRPVLSFLLISTNLLLSCDFGEYWTDILNISYKGMCTGSDGNVYRVSTNGNNSDADKFDIEVLHTDLADRCQKTGVSGKSNVIIASLSIIFKVEDNKYEAINATFKDGNKILVFINGSTEKKPSKDYKSIDSVYNSDFNPDILFKDFQKRLPIIEEADEHLKHSTIRSFNQTWEGMIQAKRVSLCNALGNLVKQAEDQAFSYSDLIKEMGKQYELAQGQVNGSCGCYIDSEQYLLKFLLEEKKDLLQEQSSASGDTSQPTKICDEYNALYARYRTIKINSIRAWAQSEIRIENLEKMSDTAREVSERLSKLKDTQVVGCVLHIHSTNETCEACAYSLHQELYARENFKPLINCMIQHNNVVGSAHVNDPFFTIIASCTKDLPIPTGDHPIRPGGINKDYKLDDEAIEGNNVLINYLLNKKIFIQKKIDYQTEPAPANIQEYQKSKRRRKDVGKSKQKSQNYINGQGKRHAD